MKLGPFRAGRYPFGRTYGFVSVKLGVELRLSHSMSAFHVDVSRGETRLAGLSLQTNGGVWLSLWGWWVHGDGGWSGLSRRPFLYLWRRTGKEWYEWGPLVRLGRPR